LTCISPDTYRVRVAVHEQPLAERHTHVLQSLRPVVEALVLAAGRTRERRLEREAVEKTPGSGFAAAGFNSKATWVWDLIKPVSAFEF
jgi:hypothetical protein